MALGWRGQYFRYKEYFLNILDLYKRRAELRAFTEIVLSLSTLTIFLIFALKPTALTIIDLVKEINEKRSTLNSLDQKINDLAQAQAVYAQGGSSVLDVDTAVATNPVPDAISKQLVGLAAKDSINILGLSTGQITLLGKDASVNRDPGIKPLPGNAHEIAVSINIQGDYPPIISFLTDLENLRIASKIDLVRINTSVTSGQSVIVALISARIPYLGE